jgi:cysteine desulfurase/selenocysteine lyase
MPTEARIAALAAGLGATAAGACCLGRCLVNMTGAETTTTTIARTLPAPLSDFLLEPGLRYLNTGTLGPMPRSVIAAVSDELEYLAANPLNNYFGGGEQDAGTKRMDDVRLQLAAFMGCQVDELCLMPSTTVSFNTVADGLVDSGYLRPEHTVLQTDQEHPGGEACWRHLAGLGKLEAFHHLKVPAVPSSEDEIVALFAAAIRPSTRVICVSHVLTTSGTVLPLQRLAVLAHENDALLMVDGAQALGSLAVTLSETGVDIYTVSAHKWMLAPPGSGALYIRSAAQDLVKAAFFDADSPPVAGEVYGGDASRYMSYTHSSGTTPMHTVAGLGAAVSYIESCGGKDAVQAHNISLRDEIWRGLEALSVDPALLAAGIRLLSPPPGSELCSSIVTFSIAEGNMSAGELSDQLKSGYSIIVKTKPHHSPEFPDGNCDWINSVRLSMHVFNTSADVQTILGALRSILSQ